MKQVRVTSYLPAEMVVEVLAEAERQDRPVGWILRQALRIALPRIKAHGDRCSR